MMIRLVQICEDSEMVTFRYPTAEERPLNGDRYPRFVRLKTSSPQHGDNWQVMLCKCCRRIGRKLSDGSVSCFGADQRLGLYGLTTAGNESLARRLMLSNPIWPPSVDCCCEKDNIRSDVLRPLIKEIEVFGVAAELPEDDGELDATVVTADDDQIRYHLFGTLTALLYLREQRSEKSTGGRDRPSQRSAVERLIWGKETLRSKSDLQSVFSFLNLDALGGMFKIQSPTDCQDFACFKWHPPRGLTNRAKAVCRRWCTNLDIDFEDSEGSNDALLSTPRLQERTVCAPRTRSEWQFSDTDFMKVLKNALRFKSCELFATVLDEMRNSGCPVPRMLERWKNFVSSNEQNWAPQVVNAIVGNCVLKSEIYVEVPDFNHRLKQYPEADENFSVNAMLWRRTEYFKDRFGGTFLRLLNDPIHGGFRFLEELSRSICGETPKVEPPQWFGLRYDDTWISSWYRSLFAIPHTTTVGFDSEMDGPFYVGYSRFGESVGNLALGDAASDVSNRYTHPVNFFTDRKWGWVQF